MNLTRITSTISKRGQHRLKSNPIKSTNEEATLLICDILGNPVAKTQLTPELTIGALTQLIDTSNLFPIIKPKDVPVVEKTPPTYILLYNNKILGNPAVKLVGDLHLEDGAVIRIMETFRRSEK